MLITPALFDAADAGVGDAGRVSLGEPSGFAERMMLRGHDGDGDDFDDFDEEDLDEDLDLEDFDEDDIDDDDDDDLIDDDE